MEAFINTSGLEMTRLCFGMFYIILAKTQIIIVRLNIAVIFCTYVSKYPDNPLLLYRIRTSVEKINWFIIHNLSVMDEKS